MGLPIEIFYFLVIVAVSLFVFGLTRYSVGAGFSFTALSGVFFILTGLLLWTTGLTTDVVVSTDTSAEVITYTYQEMTFANDLAIQMFSYFFVFGGFFPIVVAIRNVMSFKHEQSRQDNLEWSV
ncbi:MAG TPA: hypothetical protein PKN54_07665 [Candidatus Cloacimonas acidaminovorans]|nr:hypothetical protein [Candidatus Paceibacterota bacterium]HNV62816.1 hypothetical protein [Candidatus Cloacimonas acidaminovorans]